MANQEQGENAQQAAAGEGESVLQNPDLPDVEVKNLNNPPQVTPAPTVRPNPNTNIPRPTATPTPSQ
jgi:hypothetical protein